MLQRSHGNYVGIATRCRGSLRSPQPSLRLVCTSPRSVGALGPVCFIAMRSQAWRGPTTSAKATSARRGAADCGPRAHRGKRSAHCNVRAPGNSCPTPRPKRSYRRPDVKSLLRPWRRSGCALLRIVSVAACRAVPCDRLKLSSISCVSSGQNYLLQAQGDCCGIAFQHINPGIATFQLLILQPVRTSGSRMLAIRGFCLRGGGALHNCSMCSAYASSRTKWSIMRRGSWHKPAK
jgi:hypothetical protein